MLEAEEPVTGEGYDWSDLLASYKRILSNIAYVTMTGVLTTNLGVVAVISIYGIQYLSEVYNMSIPSASFLFRLAFGIRSNSVVTPNKGMQSFQKTSLIREFLPYFYEFSPFLTYLSSDLGQIRELFLI